MAGCQRLAFKDIHNFIMSLVGEDLHAKRVYSLANATQGIITSASLAVSTIGQGLAAARGLLSKHAIKQVDRLLSNAGIEVDAFFVRWVPYIVGGRKSIEVAMDWTDFDDDKQATIMLSLITQHGRTTSLVWLTVDKDTLKHNRNRYEHTVLVRLAEALPSDVEVLIVADRGFGDHKLYQVLTDELKFDYLIRFRGNIKVTAAEGRDAQRHGLGRRWWPDAHFTRLCGDGGWLSRRCRCLRTGQGHEGSLVSLYQSQRRKGQEPAGQVCQALGDRVFLPRYQGSALWSRHGREPHQLARTA